MDTQNTPLVAALRAVADKNPVRFCMPGHKGNAEKFGGFLSLVPDADFTELPDTDNLYAPVSMILEAEKRTAEAFGAAETLFSAGGATLCLQACVLFAVQRAKKTKRPFFVDRLCHLSVMNAFVLCDLDPVWVYPDDKELTARITAENPCAILITSPDYYGTFRLSHSLISVCHAADCLVLCDNSHGTHLAFYEDGTRHPLMMGADLVVDSAHKTLPSLTGAAFLHIGSMLREERDTLLQNMRLFGSTSPSFPILASLDGARAYMQAFGASELARVRALILKTRETLTKVGFSFADEETSDIFRLTIDCSCIKIDGRKLYDFLSAKQIFCEFADACRVICICTVADEAYFYEKLTFAALAYAKENNGSFLFSPMQATMPEKVLSLREARFADSACIPLTEAKGAVSAESYAPYPPGIPVIVPGERFDDNVILALSEHVSTVRIIRS